MTHFGTAYFTKGKRFDLDRDRPGSDVWEITMPVKAGDEATHNILLGRVGARGKLLAFGDGRNQKGMSVAQMSRWVERGSAVLACHA